MRAARWRARPAPISRMALRLCFITAEVAPLAKTGGLADVCGALTRYLHDAGHDVRTFMPFYGSIDRTRYTIWPIDALQDIPLQLGPHRYRYSVHAARVPGSSALVYLIDCPVLYARPSLYTFDPDEHLRFLALTRAAIECCQRMAWGPHILHCHDWHAAFGPLFLKTYYSWDQLFKATRSILTIHNIGYQGMFGAISAGDLALGTSGYMLHQDDLRAGVINSLKHGVMYADAITTVSPTYAHEICTPEGGMGLDVALRARADSVVGILNGVDYEEWDPRTDRHLPKHYDATQLSIKSELKQQLLARFDLLAGARTALLGIVTRLSHQKGIDMMLEALPHVLSERDVVCAALGSGDAYYQRGMTQLMERFPRRFRFHRGYSEELAHWIEAASDTFLMPSLYEPCGLNQMYSLRYGTPPIVRKTGGLADSVQRYDPATGTGTGIVFEPPTAAALTEALHSALDLFVRPSHWTRMIRNGMAQNFSWQHQGAEYVELYERLTRVVSAA
jgi:starch synthase